MSSPRSGLGVVAAFVMAVAAPVLVTATAILHAEPAGQPAAAVHVDPLPWNAPWPGGLGTGASSSLVSWELPARWLAPAQSGLLIAIDPVSRRPVRPTAEQRQAFSDLLGPDEASPDLPAVRLSRGGEAVHLNGRFLMFSIARRDASGRLILDCVSDPAHAAMPVASSPSTRLEPKER